jgi:hypothetical protein
LAAAAFLACARATVVARPPLGGPIGGAARRPWVPLLALATAMRLVAVPSLGASARAVGIGPRSLGPGCVLAATAWGTGALPGSVVPWRRQSGRRLVLTGLVSMLSAMASSAKAVRLVGVAHSDPRQPGPWAWAPVVGPGCALLPASPRAPWRCPGRSLLGRRHPGHRVLVWVGRPSGGAGMAAGWSWLASQCCRRRVPSAAVLWVGVARSGRVGQGGGLRRGRPGPGGSSPRRPPGRRPPADAPPQ